MTDKDIKDYCKNCDVEPPAMRFKCPECEHNPNNENNFAKDINVPHKEQIIIDGVDVSECEYLKYDKIGCSADDCYCLGNDCYYKQLARKTQECEELKEDYTELEQRHNEAFQDFKRIRQEYENLKSEAKELFNAKLELLRDLDHYKRAYYSCQKSAKEKFVAPIPLPPAEFVDDRYRKALEEIKKVCIEDVHTFADGTELRYDSLDKILDIINKAKGRIDD